MNTPQSSAAHPLGEAAGSAIRKITATIVVTVHTHDPKDMLKAASNRQRDLTDWLKRHQKDIENEMAYCDDVSIEVVMGYADE